MPFAVNTDEWFHSFPFKWLGMRLDYRYRLWGLAIVFVNRFVLSDSLFVNKNQENNKRNKCNEKYLRHGYLDNRGNGLVCRYKCQGACTRRGVGEYAQRLHLLALGLATRVWFSCAMWSCVCGNHLHSRVGTGACAGSGNQFGHAWRMSPVIINAIVIRKTGALCPSRTLSKRFLASCKVIQDSPSGCCTEWDLSITASDKSVHPIG